MASHDYTIRLSDLMARKLELEKELVKLKEAIELFDSLSDSGIIKDGKVLASANTQAELLSNISQLGVYEATVRLLEKENKIMKTKEIMQLLIDNNVIKKSTPFNNVASTLYKAEKDKKNCKIKRVSAGEWGLVSWVVAE